MRRIEALLRRAIGLDAASIGSTLIERSIRLRMKLHGMENFGDYEQLVRSSRGELDELTESVVVTETWFFRDRDPFQAFTLLLLGDWLLRHPGRAARILSVPCSSGEEPYSLAMALLDAGIAPDRFEIHGVDISARALERAERATYGRNSFRGPHLEYRDRHFVLTRDGYCLKPLVKNQVSFSRANILDEDFLSYHPPFDFIFCRNLLIYFDRATQTLTLGKLHRLLAPNGILFVGPAELPLVQDNGFVSAKIPQAFACRKTTTSPILPKPGSFRSLRQRIKRAAPRNLTNGNNLPPPVTASPRELSPKQMLAEARRLADLGQLDHAAAICKTYLARHSDCAEGYYLLGLVQDAANDPQAITSYRKALYLNPNHYEALVHAAAWLEKSGDPTAAQPLKLRAERAQPRLGTQRAT